MCNIDTRQYITQENGKKVPNPHYIPPILPINPQKFISLILDSCISKNHDS